MADGRWERLVASLPFADDGLTLSRLCVACVPLLHVDGAAVTLP